MSMMGRRTGAWIGLVGTATVVVLALLAPVLAPQDPYDLASLNFVDGRLPPGATGVNGTVYWMGTDEQGRDILSAILYGLRTSIAIGLVSTLLALAFGTLYGLVSGYVGGRVDSVLMRIVDLQLSIPTILIALILLAILGKGVDKIMIALISAQWAGFARIARAASLVESQKASIAAARGLRLAHSRIVTRHLLPNCLPPLVVVGTMTFAGAISLEATLSFLGLGVPVTEPSIGLLIANGFEYLLSGRYWISTYPGIALVVTIICINLLGDHLRDTLNPRLERVR